MASSLAGRRTEARTVFLRAIKSRERALSGKKYESQEVMYDALKLGGLYEQVGRFDYAETLYKRVVAAQEKAHGPIHPDVAKALEKLSMFYTLHDRYSELEAVIQRRLTILEKTQDATHFADPNLPPDLVINFAHMDTMSVLNDLADLCGTLGRYSEMEALVKRNLSTVKAERGENDSLVAIQYMQLGRIAVFRGRYADAESYFRRALEIEERERSGGAACATFSPRSISGKAAWLADFLGLLAHREKAVPIGIAHGASIGLCRTENQFDTVHDLVGGAGKTGRRGGHRRKAPLWGGNRDRRDKRQCSGERRCLRPPFARRAFGRLVHSHGQSPHLRD